jgi:hypothetical protein
MSSRSSRYPGRVRRRVRPQDEGALASSGAIDSRSSRPSRMAPAPVAARERGAHRVGRITDRRVEHGVALRANAGAGSRRACRQTPWCRRRPRRRSLDTVTPNRRWSHPARRRESRSIPGTSGSPGRRRPSPTPPAPSKGGSNGVPMEQSMAPPSCADASFLIRRGVRRGTGGGVKLMPERATRRNEGHNHRVESSTTRTTTHRR